MQPAPLSTYQLGRIQSLRILRLVSIGAYLDGGIQDILLPLHYLPEGAKEGDMVSVFVYHDNEGRLIATTLTPFSSGRGSSLSPLLLRDRCGSLPRVGHP